MIHYSHLFAAFCQPSGVLADFIPAGINLHPGAHDKLAWTVEGDGAFSIWSAYNHLHQTCSFSVQLQRAFTEILTPPAPLKISFKIKQFHRIEYDCMCDSIYYTRNINEPNSCNCSGYPLLAFRSIS